MEKTPSTSSVAPGGLDLTQAFFKPINHSSRPSPAKRNTKISIIGTGDVGMAIAQIILTKGIADELVLFDATTPAKVLGEMLDLQQAATFFPRTKIVASNDYAVTAGSDICIITAGAPQLPGETRLQGNVALFQTIVPPLAKYSPDAVLLVVANSVDVLTYVTWKLSGFPWNRVIGSGTILDSSRFRSLIADHLHVNVQDVQAYIIGEHGDRSVAPLSSITYCGFPIENIFPRQQIAYKKETLENMHKQVINNASEVIRLKGCSFRGMSYAVADLVSSIIGDERKIHPVSLLATGFHGIEGGEPFLSLPAQLGRGGILSVTDIHLTEQEAKKLKDSAKTVLMAQSQLGL